MVPIKTAVLQALRSESLHGLMIIRRVEELSDGVILLKQGSVFPALHDLEDEGFIEVVQKKQKENKKAGRTPVWYQLTQKGRQRALEERLTASKLFRLSIA